MCSKSLDYWTIKLLSMNWQCRPFYFNLHLTNRTYYKRGILYHIDGTKLIYKFNTSDIEVQQHMMCFDIANQAINTSTANDSAIASENTQRKSSCTFNKAGKTDTDLASDTNSDTTTVAIASQRAADGDDASVSTSFPARKTKTTKAVDRYASSSQVRSSILKLKKNVKEHLQWFSLFFHLYSFTIYIVGLSTEILIIMT